MSFCDCEKCALVFAPKPVEAPAPKPRTFMVHVEVTTEDATLSDLDIEANVVDALLRLPMCDGIGLCDAIESAVSP